MMRYSAFGTALKILGIRANAATTFEVMVACADGVRRLHVLAADKPTWALR